MLAGSISLTHSVFGLSLVVAWSSRNKWSEICLSCSATECMVKALDLGRPTTASITAQEMQGRSGTQPQAGVGRGQGSGSTTAVKGLSNGKFQGFVRKKGLELVEALLVRS